MLMDEDGYPTIFGSILKGDGEVEGVHVDSMECDEALPSIQPLNPNVRARKLEVNGVAKAKQDEDVAKGVAPPIKKRLKGLIWPLVFACLAVYFGVHLVRNDHGVLAMQAFDLRIVDAENELAGLTATRVGLERDTALLRPETMHPDSLGEHARRRLNMGAEREVVVFQK